MTELEQQISNQINDSLRDAIKGVLSNSWNSPLGELIKGVVSEHYDDIKSIINTTLSNFIRSDSFAETLKEEMNHKLAKSCVSMLDSQVEKSLNSIKQDPMLRAKMVIALENVIKENSLPE